MLFRAALWIGVVSLLMPHAHENGARSGISSSHSSPVATAAVGDFQDVLRDRLAALKADIEAAERARADRGG